MSLVQGRGTSDCRYEHEPQIRFLPRSFSGGSVIVIVGKEAAVEQMYERVAGLDVHRDSVVACFRQLGPRGGVVREKERFKTTTAGLQVLEAWLAERQVQLVAMEATGVIGSLSCVRWSDEFTVCWSRPPERSCELRV